MAPENRDTLTQSIQAALIHHTTDRLAGRETRAERAATQSEIGSFMARHARCAVLQSEGPAARVMGQRLSAECLDCGDAVEWWKAPAGVTALAGLN